MDRESYLMAFLEMKIVIAIAVTKICLKRFLVLTMCLLSESGGLAPPKGYGSR